MIPGGTPVAVYAIAELPAELAAATESPLAALLRNPRIRRSYLLEASPFDPAAAGGAGALATVRLSTDGYHTKPTDPALPGVLFPARLEAPLNAEVRILDEAGRLRTRSLPTFGELTIINPRGELDALAGYEWAQRDVTVKVGAPSFLYPEFGGIFGGTAEAISWTMEQYRLTLRDRGYHFQRPVQSSRYRGSGPCLRLDGVDDSLAAAFASPAGSMTWEAWVKPRSLASAFKTIMGWGQGAAGDRVLQLHSAAPNRIEVFLRNDAAVPFTIYFDTLAANVWSHVAVVLDAVGLQARLYVNGVLAGVPATLSGTFNTTRTDFAIGKQGNAASRWADIEIDEPRVWSTARTQAEIIANKDRELQGNEPGLAHYWKLNEATGGTAFDSVAGGVNLTVTGAAWIGSLEGEASIAGQWKPRGFGQVRQFEPVLVDSVNLIYQLNDGPIQAVDAVKVAGSALTAAGDVADLYATTVTAGQYKTDLSRGLIRLGAKPVAPSGSGAGVLTADFRGDNAGGYVATAGGIGKKLCRLALPDAKIELTAFDALATLAPAVIGLAARLEQLDLDAALDQVLGSVGAYWTQTRPGLVTTARLDAPGATTGELTERDVVLNEVERLVIAPPLKSLTLGGRRYYRPIAGSDLAGALTAEQQADLGKDLRYVTSPNLDPTTATRHLDAQEVTLATLLDVLADLQAEADRRMGLYGERRELYKAPLVNGLFNYEVGACLLFKIQRFDLSAGRPMVVVGWIEDVANESISLLLWG